MHSLGFRFGLIAALTTLLLVAVLFTSYVVKRRDDVYHDEIRAARETILMAESVLENMEYKWQMGLFKAADLRAIAEHPTLTKEEKKARILATIPVVNAWEAARTKVSSGPSQFRIPRQQSRNADNEPTPLEAQALAYFAANPSAQEHVIFDQERNALRYFRPVRLRQSCLICHGDPATSQALWGNSEGKDLAGFAMDGKQEGDLHGAFEVITPLAQSYSSLYRDVFYGGSIALGLLFVTIGVQWFALRRLITRPLQQAVLATEGVAHGELNQQIALPCSQKRDEISRLIQALGQMRQRLGETILAVRDATGQVVDSAREIAQGSWDLSQRTEQQATHLEAAASNVEELNATVQGNAANAQLADQLAATARQTAQRGDAMMGQVINAMGAIDGSSQKIADIIGVIDEIAFQTNLLALNASVEAARAGEQGRGFAVVAAEVRNLAQRSATAAKEIRILIQDSVAKVADGSELVNATGATLKEIVTSAEQVGELIAAIAAASHQQTSGIAQVNGAVQRMEEKTQQDAALVQETAAAAETLKQLASEVEQRLAYFQVAAAPMTAASGAAFEEDEETSIPPPWRHSA